MAERVADIKKPRQREKKNDRKRMAERVADIKKPRRGEKRRTQRMTEKGGRVKKTLSG